MSKITRAKWTGGVAQLIEHKALCSNPTPTKKKLSFSLNEYLRVELWGLVINVCLAL
jgi:hypothetical protein